MLQGIAAPLLPFGQTEDERKKLDELRARLSSIPVFFVSALAHEMFAGRFKATSRQKGRFVEQFNDDPEQTGIPALRDHLNQLAELYLATNFYEELELRLRKEVDYVVQYFRKHFRTLHAEVTGAGEQVRTLVDSAKGQLVPWVRQEVQERGQRLQDDALVAATEIRHRLDQASLMSDRRLQDKFDTWRHIAWNSLRATARKGGAHTTCRGIHIDIKQDICSVLVDDIIVAWASYRDNLIQARVTELTDRLATELRERLEAFVAGVNNAEAAAAVHDIIGHLETLSDRQRLELLRKVNAIVGRLESLRRPAYDIIADEMAPVFAKMAEERGAGCLRRMHAQLERGFATAIVNIRRRIRRMVDEALGDLALQCGAAVQEYGEAAAQHIGQSLADVEALVVTDRRELAQERLEAVSLALQLLPRPA